jgi:hypothetical protein
MYRSAEKLYRVMVGKTEGNRHLQDTGIDDKIILIWVLEKKV